MLYHTGVVGTLAYASGLAWIGAMSYRIARSGWSEAPALMATLSGTVIFLAANATNLYLEKYDYVWVIFLPVAFVNAWLVSGRDPSRVTTQISTDAADGAVLYEGLRDRMFGALASGASRRCGGVMRCSRRAGRLWPSAEQREHGHAVFGRHWGGLEPPRHLQSPRGRPSGRRPAARLCARACAGLTIRNARGIYDACSRAIRAAEAGEGLPQVPAPAAARPDARRPQPATSRRHRRAKPTQVSRTSLALPRASARASRGERLDHERAGDEAAWPWPGSRALELYRMRLCSERRCVRPRPCSTAPPPVCSAHVSARNTTWAPLARARTETSRSSR